MPAWCHPECKIQDLWSGIKNDWLRTDVYGIKRKRFGHNTPFTVRGVSGTYFPCVRDTGLFCMAGYNPSGQRLPRLLDLGGEDVARQHLVVLVNQNDHFPQRRQSINQIGEHVVCILCLVQWSDAIGYGGLEQNLFQQKCQSVYLLFPAVREVDVDNRVPLPVIVRLVCGSPLNNFLLPWKTASSVETVSVFPKRRGRERKNLLPS